MIISCSGKIGSGKDLVGEIIRYLISKDIHALHPDSKFNPNNIQYTESKWEVRKFAGKLKEVVALLTGCTVQDLESQEFKNSMMDNIWNYSWGKDYTPVSPSRYADDEVFKANPDRFTLKYTYREFLQLLGTQAMRDVIHENVWVNALFSKYKLSPDTGLRNYKLFKGEIPTEAEENKENYPNWIITDTRFPNELDAVVKNGGITIKVARNFLDSMSSIVGSHESETALDAAEFKYVIINDGTIEDLITKVASILKTENIIK